MKVTINNYAGKRVGTFVALRYLGKQTWECKCDCGKIKNLRSDKLRYTKWNPICSKECPKKIRYKNSKRPPGENGLLAMYRNYKKQIPRRGLEWNLSIEQFKNITSGNCYYCGTPPNRIITAKYAAGVSCIKKFTPEYIKNFEYTYNGVDRVDTLKGYSWENCVSCCTECNYAKHKLSKESFLNHVEKIYLYQKCKKD